VRILVFLTLLTLPALAADRFTGLQSCASSGCHGGGKGDDQLWVWMKKDPHARADSILGAERSKRIGEALGIADTVKSEQCTVCHSPMQSAAPERLAAGVKANRGVSCEACHGPGEKWLRFHTRPDATHAQRVASGMRDLSQPAQRGNTCAGCHLHLPAGLQAAGHPELRFELARQIAEMPPHWTGDTPMDAPRSWIAGQAVSLRELAWRVQKSPDEGVTARIAALHWILRQTESGKSALPENTDDLGALRTSANRLANSVPKTRWTESLVKKQIQTICENAPMFRDAAQDPVLMRRRAEVIVPAVRALSIALGGSKGGKLDEVIRGMDDQLRSPVSFTPATFASLLESVPAVLP
jgi:Cytochrome c554 and c-prime